MPAKKKVKKKKKARKVEPEKKKANGKAKDVRVASSKKGTNWVKDQIVPEVKVVNLVTVEPDRHLVEVEVLHPPIPPPKNWKTEAHKWLAKVWKHVK